MCRHENKQCPRCASDFECKVNNVLQCQCAGIELSERQREYVATQYHDCLCAACLHQVRMEFDTMAALIAARS